MHSAYGPCDFNAWGWLQKIAKARVHECQSLNYITKQQITRNLAFRADSWSLWSYLHVSLPYLVEQSIWIRERFDIDLIVAQPALFNITLEEQQ